MPLLFVFIGGGAGSVLRYLLGKSVSVYFASFPAGTLVANLLAVGIMGLGLWLFRAKNPAWLHPLLLAGFCGGLSTFSTFSYETAQLVKQGHLWMAGLNVLVSLGAGIGAALYVVRMG